MIKILDHVTKIDFTPGSNIKGYGLGANPVYFFPRFEFKRILCVGRPTKNLVVNLQSLTEELILDKAIEDVAENVTILALEAIADLSIDCVYVCDNTSITVENIERILKPDGIIYYEYRGWDRTQFSQMRDHACAYWLTPAFGSVQTAVPLNHPHTTQFLKDKRLYVSSVREHTFEQFRKRLKKKSPAVSTNNTHQITESPTAKKKSDSRLRYVLRIIRRNLVRFGAGLEYVLTQTLPTRLFRRYGVVVRRSTGVSSHPPDYLQEIALKNQLDIKRWEWVFVARGDYPSQKILFYLIPENQLQPAVIVKMVRTSRYNKHLEREVNGLNYLHQSEFKPLDTIPEVLFHGYHNDLIVVGESVLDGKPFAEQTQFNAECPYANFIVQWLLDLGQATQMNVDAEQVTDILQNLYDRFLALYKPDEGQRTFLAGQLDQLKALSQWPLVFCHGDPGIHNFLVKPDDKVAVLDWENAEIHGLPFWDLFYFLTDFCVKAGTRNSTHSHLSAYQHYFLDDSPLQPFVIESLNRYCKTIGIDSRLIAPLYYVFLIYRSLKQAVLFSPEQLKNASSWRLLQLTITHQDASLFQSIAKL